MTCKFCGATIAGPTELVEHRCPARPGTPVTENRSVPGRRHSYPTAERGTRSCYQNGCDHPECRAENARYMRERRSA